MKNVNFGALYALLFNKVIGPFSFSLSIDLGSWALGAHYSCTTVYETKMRMLTIYFPTLIFGVSHVPLAG